MSSTRTAMGVLSCLTHYHLDLPFEVLMYLILPFLLAACHSHIYHAHRVCVGVVCRMQAKRYYTPTHTEKEPMHSFLEMLTMS